MNAKQLRWAVAALVVVLGLWGVSEALTDRPDDRQTGQVLPLDVAGINRIVFAGPEDTVFLARQGTEWKVNGFDVATDQLVSLFESFTDSTESEIVATSATVHQRMGVDGTGHAVVYLRDLDTAATVLFGRRGRDGESYFARRAGQDEVYRYTGPLAAVVDNDQDAWRDNVITDVMPDAVAAVVIRGGRVSYALTRQLDGRWAVGEETADSAKAEQLLTRLRPLKASGFASGAQLDSVHLDPPDRELILLSAAGDTLSALEFDSTDSGYWVRRRNGQVIYQLPSYRVDQLLPAVSTFRPGGS